MSSRRRGAGGHPYLKGAGKGWDMGVSRRRKRSVLLTLSILLLAVGPHPATKAADSSGRAASQRRQALEVASIDTLHLAEVPPAILALSRSKAMTPETLAGLQVWFGDYAHWITTHKYGIDEMNAKNNHSVAYMVQLAAFATLTGDTQKLDLCRQRYKEVFVPQQMAPDGSFPQELKRTKPYGYSIFQLDNMAILCQLLSTERDNLWTYTLPDGRGIRKAVEFLYPFLLDRTKWPYKPDVEHFESWPVRQPALLFAAQAFNEKKYLDLWKTLDPDPTDQEVQRNMAITQPLLWLISSSDVPLSRD